MKKIIKSVSKTANVEPVLVVEPSQPVSVGISLLNIDFHREDLNLLASKINEVILNLNER